jgi:hypothetical protein
MSLIFLTGHHYAGKSTLAKWLVDRRGFREVVISNFLREEALKRIHAMASISGRTGVTMETFHLGKDKPWLLSSRSKWPTPRDYLKDLGQELCSSNPKVLAAMAQSEIKRIFAQDPKAKIIVSDWRFPHEIEWALESSYPVTRWRIYRPETHPSDEEIRRRGVTEAHIDTMEVDQRIRNDGTLEDLYRLGLASSHGSCESDFNL